jgi:putative chitinase
MDTLRKGSSGPDVAALQTQLQAKGFSPGAIDGSFGAGTAAAVVAFQQSQGLTPDGIVGPSTAAALGLTAPEPAPPSALPNVTVDVVAQMFPNTPRRNISANLPAILDELVNAKVMSPPLVLAALATIRAETEGFVPISEGISRFNTTPGGGHPFDLYDNRSDLGNLGPPDGERFKGRGYVQLTGRHNYTVFGPIIKVNDLVDRPDQANDPQIAAKLLAAFIASKAGAIGDALAVNDLAKARRLVNGGSNGVDRFADAYGIGTRLLAADA